MCLIKYHVLILCLIIVQCYALNCRSDVGPKEAELKNLYKKCLKMQDAKNSSKGNSDQVWKESRGQSEKSNWDRDRMDDNRNYRHDRTSARGKMNGRDDDMIGRSENRRGSSSDKRGSGSDLMSGNNDRTGSPSDRMGRDDYRGNRNNDRTDDRSSQDRMSSRNGREDMEGNQNNRYGRNGFFNGRDDFLEKQSEEYRGELSQYNNYYSTPSPRRYKREKHSGNSGQRSQYNPNTHKTTGHEDDEKNARDNSSSKEVDKKACALHCFLESLEMTAEDGMPDRYLVTQAITKDIKNEDLKEFLQESIEECFQILVNENTEEKCEFSKNLLMCLSEKGRANCDDWKDDLKF